jgi:hypothetical protein
VDCWHWDRSRGKPLSFAVTTAATRTSTYSLGGNNWMFQRMWEIAGILLFSAVVGVVFALLPVEPVRWGSGRSRRKGPPMSTGGRIATGYFFAYTYGLAVIRECNLLTMTIYFLLFFGGTLVYLRDRRNHNNATRLDEGSGVID